MFTGIIEEVSTVFHVEKKKDSLQIWLRRPPSFTDIKAGDSIAVNGVCLTLEGFKDHEMVFSLGSETLRILEHSESRLLNSRVNLERSLKFGDRVHGHLVSGHVEDLGLIKKSEGSPESWFLDVEFPMHLRPFLWAKGSVTLNGVSLTINSIHENLLSVCLIPETLKRTQLGDLILGDPINIETDYFAKAFLNFKNNISKPGEVS